MMRSWQRFTAGAALVARWLLRRYTAAKPDRGPWALTIACSAVMAAVAINLQRVYPSLGAAPAVGVVSGFIFLWLFARQLPAEDLNLIRTSLPAPLAPAARVLEALSGHRGLPG